MWLQGPYTARRRLLNADFIRQVGTAVEGCWFRPERDHRRAAAGQPFSKQISIGLPRGAREGQWRGTDDGFSAYSFRCLAHLHGRRQAHPGDCQAWHAGIPLRAQERDLTTKELSGTHAIYNFKPARLWRRRARLVLVRLTNGQWKYAP